MNTKSPLPALVLLFALLLLWPADKLPLPTPGPSDKATAVTFVYEKDQHVVPSPVLAALNKLNRERDIVATIFEQDTKDGSGQVPRQYQVPLAAAKQAGLPALVVTAGDTVLKVVREPKSEADVLEAVP